MADQQHRAVELVERIFQDFDVLDVEVVGGFVEHQQVGPGERHEGQRHAGPLAAAEGADFAEHFVAGEAEGAEVILDVAAAPERPLLLNGVRQRQLERKVGQVLSEPRRRNRTAHARLATRRREIPQHRGDERRLARPIGADQRDEVVAPQRSGEVLHQHAARHFHAQRIDGDHLIATALRNLELKRHRGRIAYRRRETRQAFESFALALGLKRVDAGQVPPDVFLFFLHVRALLLHFTFARESTFGALGHELAVVPLVRFAGLRLDVQNVRADGIHERAIVRYHEHGFVALLEPLLQPGGGVEVEVIGGFVEHQQVGGRDKLRRQPHTSALTTRQRRDEPRF